MSPSTSALSADSDIIDTGLSDLQLHGKRFAKGVLCNTLTNS